MHDGRDIEDEEHILLRCEDLKHEREAVVDCMMELESEFLTATNVKKVVMILDQACRNFNVGKSVRSCGSVDSNFSLCAWCYMEQ